MLLKMCSYSKMKTLRNLIFLINNSLPYKTYLMRSISVKVKESKVEDIYTSASDPKARRLYAWGCAMTGALGEVKVIKKRCKWNVSKFPLRKNFAYSHKVVDIACGLGFSLFAVHNVKGPKLFGCGLNTDSQIGFQCVRGPAYPMKMLHSVVPIRTPLKSELKTTITKVAAGRAHSLALTNQEGVLTFGNNDFGQCARPIVKGEDYSRFKELWKTNICDGEKIVDIICGQDHSLFLTENGRVYSCGNGADGQTGLGHLNVTWKPSLVGGDITGENIVKISSTTDSVLALNDKGDIFGWGNGEYFQIPTLNYEQQIHTPRHLSRIQKLGKIKDVASAGTISMVLTEDKQVFVWGYGILGKGPKLTYCEEPTPIPSTLFGYNQYHTDITVESLACGVTTLAAINNAGDLFLWGKNHYGQLGLGHKNDQYFPLKVSLPCNVIKVSCGMDHTMALCKPQM